MIFGREMKVDIPLVDFSSEAAEERNAEFAELIDRDARTPFDLIHGPVMRASLVRFAARSHVLLFTSHHIVCDGWSMNVIVNEFGKVYSAKCSRQAVDLPKPLAFGRYAERQRAESDSPESQRVEQYWLKKYTDPAPLLNLPIDHPAAIRKGIRRLDHPQKDWASELREDQTRGSAERRHTICDLARRI